MGQNIWDPRKITSVAWDYRLCLSASVYFASSPRLQQERHRFKGGSFPGGKTFLTWRIESRKVYKTVIFWIVTPRNLDSDHQRFRGIRHLHLRVLWPNCVTIQEITISINTAVETTNLIMITLIYFLPLSWGRRRWQCLLCAPCFRLLAHFSLF